MLRKILGYSILGSTLSLGLVSCASNDVAQDFHDEGTPTQLDDLTLNLPFVKKTLANGMNVILLENNKLPLASIYVFYDVGGRYEYPGVTGSTHFLEHMMFKKTKNFPAEYFSQVVEGSGGNSNAYTTFDNTVYYENFPADKLSTMLDLEVERMTNLELEEGPFESERQVVLEERKMRYENKAGGQLYLKMMKEMFVGTPYGGSVIGEESDVKNLSREKMLEFYHQFYTPNNATMIIVGDINANDTFDVIKKKFESIPVAKNLKEVKEKLDHADRYKFQARLPKDVAINGQSETPMFMMAYPSVAVGVEDGYALDLLSKVLGSGESSYLSKKFVISKKPELSYIYASNYTLKNSGVFYIQGQLLDKVSFKHFENGLKKEMTSICDKSIDERAVQKTKNNLLVEMYGNLETNDGIASFIGNLDFFLGNPDKYKDELKYYNNLTAKDLVNVCKKYLNPKKALFVSVWKKHPVKK